MIVALIAHTTGTILNIGNYIAHTTATKMVSLHNAHSLIRIR